MNALTHAWGTNNCWVIMRHNAQVVSQAFSAYANNDQSASMLAILLLQQGDDVHTVLLAGRSLYGNGWSHWGGFLLAQV